MTRSHLAFLSVVACCLPAGVVSADAGDSFFEAEVLSVGQTSVDDSFELPSEGFYPDLFLGVFDESGQLTQTDDDSSFLGDGFAPALFGVPINPGGEIDFSVTGAPDESLEGAHSQFGDYRTEVAIYDSEGEFLDFFEYDGYLEEGLVDSYFESDEGWDGGTYDVMVNNAFPNDVDFFRFVGLTPGQSFTVNTEPSPLDPFSSVDTYLGWFDETGSEIATNDDISSSPLNLYSRLSGVVPENGELVFGVSGYGDYAFDGYHGEQGEYSLVLSVGGDYDFDGDVDAQDYSAWRDAYGQTGQFLAADGNFDGVVDAADYTVWRDNYNGAAVDAGAVPEPGSAFLVIVVAVGLTRPCRTATV
ncbi:hypothetical protein KOR34_40720 [Posidoniimonas corsicana]|uniref:PEP-CTERM protein-sorting domain-containing protein n=1 Tax=Posidoniimonas corsicana TaxID=1938618 RepID=A0A5C5V2U2_9BACT|nr:hypothetical protein [Posidoniimonas corsicana]TWT32310.1 hypothetical protein KOR34_40720 [Posidoniimonas corsicana]